MARKNPGEDNLYGTPTSTSFAAITAVESATAHCLLVRGPQIVTMYSVVAVQCANAAAMCAWTELGLLKLLLHFALIGDKLYSAIQ